MCGWRPLLGKCSMCCSWEHVEEHFGNFESPFRSLKNLWEHQENLLQTQWEHFGNIKIQKNQNLLKFNFRIISKNKSKLKILIRVGCVGLGIICQEKLDLALKWMGLIFGNILLVDPKPKNIPFDKKIKKKNSRPQSRRFLWKQRTNQHWLLVKITQIAPN